MLRQIFASIGRAFNAGAREQGEKELKNPPVSAAHYYVMGAQLIMTGNRYR